MHCPKCGQSAGFVLERTHCVVVQILDDKLDPVEVVDVESTEDTIRAYYCRACGSRLLPEDLEEE
ncbi:hypothetical protein EDD75_0308 [Thermodesulfitimonas autotrophica]|uniref:Uncharacterized protein n=1 Tax=Thermodesulfitimonas autotrophica TaxID=1894989 RepID=A0A3N5BPE3_9THEO|nr:hypothetical protein [Thermodesulfitimonas autotrophica]RPF49492.1 hypothetical protein EDD75_0308 [Thermodesulfitimonas autotrophica]